MAFSLNPEAPGALARYGWSDRVAALYSDVEPADRDGADPFSPVPARVVRVDRDRCLVVTPGGESSAAATNLPATGDWVMVVANLDDPPPPFRVAEVLPAWSQLVRHSAGDATAAQVLAANVDLVFVMVGLDRNVNQSRLDRELAVAWDSGARPVIVLTKADAVADPSAAAAAVTDAVVGAEVVLTSSLDGSGVSELQTLIGATDTVVLLGASGVGKSTLANRLLGEEVLATGEVRTGDHKGRHTTTARHLLPLPGGGVLIDTPGIRGLGLWDAAEGISLTFPDVEALVEGCRFRDCNHDREPGCAITAAIADGSLSVERLASWRKLLAEVERVERMRDMRAQAERTREIKVLQRAMRRRGGRP